MLDESRIGQIERTIAQVEAEGRPWTNVSIYTVVGGNYSELAQYLKVRRGRTARAGGGAATALAEAEVEAQEPPTLQEQLAVARLAQSHASGRLAQLKSQGDSMLLSEAEEDEITRLEHRLTRMEPVLERLRREVEQEREVADVETFCRSWQDLVDAKTRAYEGFVAAVRQMWLALMAIEQRHLAQEAAIDCLPPKLAKRLHQDYLPDVSTIRKCLSGTMVNARGWDTLLSSPLPPQVQTAAEVSANDPGCRPLPARLLTNFLEGSL